MMSGKCESCSDGSCGGHGGWCGVIVRLLVASVFLYAGYNKLTNIEGTAAMIASVGLPWATGLAWVGGLVEVVAGVLLVAGYCKRYAAWALAIFTIVATYFFHLKGAMAGDGMQWVQVFKNLGLIAALSMLAGCGKCDSHGSGKCGVCGGPVKEGETKCEACKNK